ncbi:MAG: NADH-quinone oxidoreductase subunit M [Leadbetterella sp.]|nr:NADH-quinone oxidoreductase subunit M [Leadbetterella sp.]
MESGILSSLILLPLLGSLLIVILPKAYKVFYKWICLITQILLLINVTTILGLFDRTKSEYQFIEHSEWFRLSLGSKSILSIDYILGVDGLSISLVLLSSIVFLVAAVSSFKITYREKTYFSLFLLLTASVFGCFLAVDFFLFFVFFEFMLLPMYFLIGIWGGENRAFASLKFFIYTFSGSVLILVVMICMVISNQDEFFTSEYARLVYSFDFRTLKDSTNLIDSSILSIKNPVTIFGLPARDVMFLLLLVGFGIKMPVVPFHTWLPDAHVEAPTPISVVLAGILLKIGGYGILRVAYEILPDATVKYAVLIGALGLVSIIYGALNALNQTDLKKMIAYSSVSHMGFVFLGISAFNSIGFNGAMFQMFSHGILSSMLFLVAGVIYERTHNRNIDAFQGLAKKMPVYTLLVAVAFFGSLGLPSLSGFIGEFLTLHGAFQSDHLPKLIPVLGILGIVLSAIYFLRTFQRMFFGEFHTRDEYRMLLKDLSKTEIFMLGSLAVLTILTGVWPSLIFRYINSGLTEILK